MRKVILLGALALAMSGSAFALTPQQQLMGTCNAQAKAANKTGEARKAFMKSCLSAKPAAPMAASAPAPAAKPLTQQHKMKVCNKNAAGKKGDERKAFMKSCLSK